ncbi:MAG TPA: alpha-1,4-glucan--maltose-1-phosphate maltosyltransferase [Thermoanaerobaculia bacterium]
MAELQFDGRRRVIIEGVAPCVDDGRFPARRVVGDVVAIEADIFADSHDLFSAVMFHRHESETTPVETRMTALVNDRWRAELPVDRLGFYYFTFEAWIDHFRTWHRDLRKRVDAGVTGDDLDVQLRIGLEMIRAAAGRARDRDRKRLDHYVAGLGIDAEAQDKLPDLWNAELLELMERNAERKFATRYAGELPIEVDPRRAAFSTWYELFPRSAAAEGGKHGTLRDVEEQLPRIARMGFDVLYLPPIHPIGTTFRKGRNNAADAEAGDVGSPWAIGGEDGGHKAIHPRLGTMDDFRRLVDAAKSRGIELAMDIAFQASPDHPYVTEHEEWFQKRPDGTIQYAENPPKKYEDIFPFHFESDQWSDLWKELCGIFRFWIDQGVRIFRVDNPHTKPLPFWHWVIRTVRKHHPDVIFLAEAFTRPKIMYWLAKAGFSQSYTYFAWRNTKYELTEYFEEITKPPVSDFFRPNAWPNTPDILTEYLQYGGRPAFTIRLMLAATLSANYGLYGPAFERFVGAPREAGGEEYLDSEKYEIRNWAPVDDDLTELIALVNRIRRENPALQQNLTLRFHETTNDDILCYSKSAGDDVVLAIVNVDPHNTQAGYVELDLAALNLDANRPFQVHELLSGARYTWHGPRNYVQLNPHIVPAHIFRIRRKVRSERDFEYFL